MTESEASTEPRDGNQDAVLALKLLETAITATIASMVLILPFINRFLVFTQEHNQNLDYPLLTSNYLSPLDILIVLLLVLSVPWLTIRRLRRPMGIALSGAVGFMLIVVIWVAMDPSQEGLLMTLRISGIMMTVIFIRQVDTERFSQAIIYPIAITAASQSLLALGQTFVWRNGMTVEATIGQPGRVWTLGHGTFGEPYNMPAFLLIAIAVLVAATLTRKGLYGLWISIAMSAAAIATTFGRSAALGLGLLIAVYALAWLLTRDSRYRSSVIAVALPFFGTALVASSGWFARAADSTAFSSNVRWELLGTAFEMLQANPLFGVGPVQYASNLDSTGGFIVHNIPALIAAEFGIAVGLMFVAWLVLLGYRSVVASPSAAALFVSPMAFFLFDNLFYVFAGGLAMVAIWLASLARYNEATILPSWSTVRLRERPCVSAGSESEAE